MVASFVPMLALLTIAMVTLSDRKSAQAANMTESTSMTNDTRNDSRDDSMTEPTKMTNNTRDDSRDDSNTQDDSRDDSTTEPTKMTNNTRDDSRDDSNTQDDSRDDSTTEPARMTNNARDDFNYETNVKDTTKVCIGSNITLDWDWSLLRGRQLEVVKWFFTPRYTSWTVIFVTFTEGFLAIVPAYTSRLTHLFLGNFVLSGVKPFDTGTYVAEIIIKRQKGSFLKMRRELDVTVEDPANYNSKELIMKMDHQAVLVNNGTTKDGGELQIQLICGPLTWRGEPPVDAIWTTPSGLKVKSTYFKNGLYFLRLDNPVEVGVYNCRLEPRAVTALCLQADDRLFSEASLRVNAVDIRLALLEGGLQRLKGKQREDTKRENEEMKELKGDLNEELKEIEEEQNEELKKVKGELNRELKKVNEEREKMNEEQNEELKKVKGELNRELKKVNEEREKMKGELNSELKKVNEELKKVKGELNRQLKKVNGQLNKKLKNENVRTKRVEDTLKREQRKSVQLSKDLLNVKRNVHREMNELKKPKPFVGFQAMLGKPNKVLNNGQRIIFKDLRINTGNGYNPRTGIFTAPRKGTYFFVWRVSAFKKGYCTCDLYVNGNRGIWTDAKYNDYFNPASGYTIVRLYRGNRVWLEASGYDRNFYFDSLLAGFLVHE